MKKQNKVFYLLSIMLLIGILFLVSCKKNEPETDPDETDTAAPTLSILSPTSDYSYLSESNTITISGIANDDTGIKSITWKDEHGNNGTASGTENWEIRNINLQSGDNVYTITAHDKADKTASAKIMITYNEYLTYIGTPFVSPNSVFVNVNTNVRICVSVMPNPNLDENSVTVVQVDQNGNEINDLCLLYDNGDLDNGDEIKGDGVFSNITNFNIPNPGDLYIRVKANTDEAVGTVTAYSSICRFSVVNEIDNETIQAIFETQDAGEAKFDELLMTLPKDEAISQTISFLNAQSNVSTASTTASNDISITYTSGLEGMILTGDEGQEGGGSTIIENRNNTKSIPLSRQTRGTYDDSRKSLADPNTITNRNALLYAPNYAQFASWGTEFLDELYLTLDNSGCNQFNINYLKNGNADLNALKTLSNYGLIVIHTHGGTDKNNNAFFVSGETATITSLHLIDWIMGRLLLGNDLKWFVKPEFIASHNNNLPNSIVYVGACHGADNTSLSTAFLSRGAQTYFGFSNSVQSSFDREMANNLFPEIVDNNKTTGAAFTPGQHDGNTPAATFVMYGNTNLSYKFGFVNGNFEEGNLNGFITEGDGRVITQLATIGPNEGYYMGIISTGLGYTDSQGSISQSFCLSDSPNPSISLKWNFLSEEFLEYVGSVFQDYFKILLVDENGTEHTLFSKSIDEIHAGYTLTPMSPAIVFDKGDVYGTGWLDLTLDLSAYAGQHVTITFAARDIGDSIYDTAILLDDITIQ